MDNGETVIKAESNLGWFGYSDGWFYVAVMMHVIVSIGIRIVTGHFPGEIVIIVLLLFLSVLVRALYHTKFLRHFLYVLDNESKIVVTNNEIIVKTGVPLWMQTFPLESVHYYSLKKEHAEHASFVRRFVNWATGRGDTLILMSGNHEKVGEIRLWAYSAAAKERLLSLLNEKLSVARP